MAIKTFETPVADRAAQLPLGWHTLQIVDAEVTYSSGRQRLRCVVKCVGSTAPGSSLGFRRDDKLIGGMSGTVGTTWYDAVGYACQFPPHDPDAVSDEDIRRMVLGRLIRAECKMQRDSDTYREIGFPRRPTAEQVEDAKAHMDHEMLAFWTEMDAAPSRPPAHALAPYADDDLPF
jgi:hypothetical protein